MNSALADAKRLVTARYLRDFTVLGMAQPAAVRESLVWYANVERMRKADQLSPTSTRELLQRCEQAGSPREAIHLVGKIFSDPDALATCFSFESGDAALAAPADDVDLGLFDVEAMEASLGLLAALPAVSNALGYAARSLLMTLQSSAGSRSLRSRVIALRLFAGEAKQELLVLESLIKTLVVSRTNASSWRNFFHPRARDWVIKIKGIMDAALRQGWKQGTVFAQVAPAVTVLDMLREDVGVALDHEAFTSDALKEIAAEDDEYLDLDFVHWKQTNTNASFCAHPWLLDAAAKYHVFLLEAEISQRLEFNRAILNDLVAGRQTSIPFVILSVRRDHLVEDTMQQMSRLPDSDLRRPLKVQFIGEEGVDVGGVRKEFFLLMMRQLLDPSFGMFLQTNETRMLYFNPDSLENQYEFQLVGSLVGLAIYNQVILDLNFPLVMYKRLLDPSAPFELKDLQDLDPSLMRGLDSLLRFDGDVESTFMRTFQASRESWGHVVHFDLVPNGSNMPVTNANRAQYVAAYLQWYLGDSVNVQMRAFEKGFRSVVSQSLLRDLLVRPAELERMIVGQQTYDFHALEASARYDDGYTKDSTTVKHFWQALHSLDLDHKKRFLKFVTGSDRVPIRGLSGIKLVISRAGVDSDSLPSAHTCFDHLLIPDYCNLEKLRAKLLLALDHAEGFGTQ